MFQLSPESCMRMAHSVVVEIVVICKIIRELNFEFFCASYCSDIIRYQIVNSGVFVIDSEVFQLNLIGFRVVRVGLCCEKSPAAGCARIVFVHLPSCHICVIISR